MWTGLSNVTTAKGAFAVQPLWSDIAGGCVIATSIVSTGPAIQNTAAIPTSPTATGPNSGRESLLAAFTLAGSGGLEWAEYGTSSTYGSIGGFQSVATANSAAVADNISGLTAGTSYHYRIHVSNTFGSVVSPDYTFIPYGVANVAAVTTIGDGKEVIVGRAHLDPSTSQTVKVNYGATSSYGGSASATLSSNSSGDAYFSVPISGLTPTATYHYQVSLGGVIETSDQTFVAIGAATLSYVTAGPNAGSGNETITAQANLNGDLNSTISVSYGTTASYGSSTPVINLAAYPNGPSEAIVNLSGLTSGVSYHYRLSITTGAGTVLGPDQTFVAKNVAVGTPVLGNSLVSPATGGVASVIYQIYLQGAASGTFTLFYGTTTGYGSSSPSQTLSAGTSVVVTNLSGLTPGTTYHLRALLTSVGGSVIGADQTFVAR